MNLNGPPRKREFAPLSPEAKAKSDRVRREHTSKARMAPLDQARLHRIREHHREHHRRNEAEGGMFEKWAEYSEVFESFMLDMIHTYKWLGENVEIRHSPYDDVVNGVDIILVFKDDKGGVVLALTLDITFSGNGTLQEKLATLKWEIQNGELPDLKYPDIASVPTENFNQVPHLVAGFSETNSRPLIEAWGADQVPADALTRHRARWMFIEEIQAQLEAFRREADLHQYHVAVEKYDAALRILLPLSMEARQNLRETFAGDLGDFESDLVHESILFRTRTFEHMNPIRPAFTKADKMEDEERNERLLALKQRETDAPSQRIEPNQQSVQPPKPRRKGTLSLPKKDDKA